MITNPRNELIVPLIIINSLQVKIEEGENGDSLAEGMEDDDEDNFIETVFIPDDKAFLYHVRTVMAIMHCMVTFSIVIAYYQLKVCWMIELCFWSVCIY